MKRSYAPPESWQGDRVMLDADESHHLLHVRRVMRGDEVTVFDGAGRVARAVVAGISGGAAELKVLETVTGAGDRCEITLVQAVVKPRAMDLVVEKATEIGVRTILPVLASRSVPRFDEEAGGKRCERWVRIARSAVKQCGTDRVPGILAVRSFPEALAYCAGMDALLIPTISGDTVKLGEAVERVRKAQSIAVFIGPEGDWSDEEVRLVRDAGGIPVSFGNRVLRSETAALYLLSVLGYEFARTIHE